MSDAPIQGRFADKTIMVTAAASGIGEACVQLLLDQGATVYASDIDLDALESRFGSDDALGDRLHLGRLDVSSYDAVKAYTESIKAATDHLDGLVNNAGLGSWGSVDNLDVNRWHTVIGVTLDSVFFTAKETMSLLRKRGGSIVNTASISGMFGDNGFAAYNAAKGGVINLTRTLAIDHAHEGVRANTVCPGRIDTPRVSWMSQNEEIISEYDRRVPMRRDGQAREVADAIAFLLSDESSFITGVALPIDGGLTASAGQPQFLRLLPDRV